MAVTRVTSETWFSRLGRSFGGILAGLLLFVLGIVLLAWNEGRAVKTAKGLAEGSASVLVLEQPSEALGLDGRLVHLTGRAETTEVLRDDVFDLEAQAIKLRRQVEMYQWQETSESQTRNKVGGGTETVTTYNYSRVWSPELIRSGGFQQPEGHQNPGSIPVPSRTLTASEVAIGPMRLGDGLVSALDRFEPLAPPSELPEGYQRDGEAIYRGNDPANPGIGDLRIRFSISPNAEVSVIARVNSDRLSAYRTKAGTTIEMLDYGRVPADDMFAAAVAANTFLLWMLRLGGLLMLFIAVNLVLGPIAVLADVLPFLGGIARFGTALIAAIIAVPTAFITIALAWLAYRPILGITLLIIAVAIPVLLVLLRKNKPAAQPA